MFCLFLLLLTYQLAQVTVATMINSPREVSAVTCIDGCSTRTLFNVIWGCVSTTIICAWAAVHPNMPPRESALKKSLRRVELMLWTILAPEILPAWAFNQLLAAKTARNVYNHGKGGSRENPFNSGLDLLFRLQRGLVRDIDNGEATTFVA